MNASEFAVALSLAVNALTCLCSCAITTAAVRPDDALLVHVDGGFRCTLAR